MHDLFPNTFQWCNHMPHMKISDKKVLGLGFYSNNFIILGLPNYCLKVGFYFLNKVCYMLIWCLV